MNADEEEEMALALLTAQGNAAIDAMESTGYERAITEALAIVEKERSVWAVFGYPKYTRVVVKTLGNIKARLEALRDR